MSSSLPRLILKHRIALIGVILVSSAFMFWKSLEARISFAGSKILPLTDSAFLYYNSFKRTFGEDGGVMVIGLSSKRFFDLKMYSGWARLSNEVAEIKGVNNVLSTGHLFDLVKDTAGHVFKAVLVPASTPTTQAQTDSLKGLIYSLPFYKGFLFSGREDANLLAVSLDQKVLNSPLRTPLIHRIVELCSKFERDNHCRLHYSGLPYIRSILSEKIASEFKLFLGLSILMSSLILFLFFRSALPVVCSLLVVVLGVIWSLGILVLFGFQMTLLTALIPSLVVIIGMPNSTLLLNRYHAELNLHHDKRKALEIAIGRIGFTTLIANVTTAIGFGVFFYTRSQILSEFGIVAFLSIMSTWFLSVIIIPILFSYLPVPSSSHTAHLDSPFFHNLLNRAFDLATRNRVAVFAVTSILVAVGFWGMSRINVNAFMVDDLPRQDPVSVDLRFFEKNFKGIMPLELSVDTRRRNGVQDLRFMSLIDTLNTKMSKYGLFSEALSLDKILKFSRQAFFGGSPGEYQLPSREEASFMAGYAGKALKESNLLKNYLDSSGRTARISFQMADAGSRRMNVVLKKVESQIDSVFPPSRYSVHITGTSVIFLKGINYLVRNLFESLALAIGLIAVIMLILFKTFKMVMISLLPNLIPLILTAGIMGFCHINLKPSTILIFSIAFGLASDQTIYFLTRFRSDSQNDRSLGVPALLRKTLQETGLSMLYAAVILFMGFSIFDASQFGGTVILGILVSVTLVFAIITNLVLLPALLYSPARLVKPSLN